MTNFILQSSSDTLFQSLYYLDCVSLCRFTLTCQYFYRLVGGAEESSQDDKSIKSASFLWYHIYKNVCPDSTCSYSPLVLWGNKVKDILSLSSSDSPLQVKFCGVNGQRQLPPRSGHSLNKLENYYIQIGGATTNYYFTNTFDIFQVESDGVTAVCCRSQLTYRDVNGFDGYDAVTPRWLHTGTTNNDESRIILYGGQDAFSRPLSDMFSVRINRDFFNIAQAPNRSWLECTLLQQDGACPRGGRAGHSTCALSNSCFLIFGGLTRSVRALGEQQVVILESCNDLFELDTSQNEQNHNASVMWSSVIAAGNNPSPRWCHSSEQSGRFMYIFGGWNYVRQSDLVDIEVTNEFLCDFFLYDIELRSWSEVKTTGICPSPRCQSPCCVVNSVRYVESMTESSELPSTGDGGYFIIFGGAYHSEDEMDLAYGSRVIDACDFHILDLQTYCWLPFQLSLPVMRGGVNANIKCNNQLWMLSGGMHSNEGEDMPQFKNDVVCIHIG